MAEDKKNEIRQMAFDFEPQTGISVSEENAAERTLGLLGSNAGQADAEVDAARMLAHTACTMARRSGVVADDLPERELAFAMLCVMQALKDGSLCAGREMFERMRSVFDEVMARREAFLGRSAVSEVSLAFEPLVELLRRFGFAVNPGALPCLHERAQGCPLLVAETAQNETFVYTRKSYAQEEALGWHLAELTRGSRCVEAASDGQEAQRAEELALNNRLTVISGGPGTGKTTAVVRILSRLLQDDLRARIFLAAPTGKAASRMKEAVAGNVVKIEDAAIREKLSGLQAKTLHRMLYTPGDDGSVPSKDSPLSADIVVVDESSMIDVALAGDLFERIDAERTKVILLGDRHQLSAVGPGSFFADVSDRRGPLADNISHLTKSWRFDKSKALGALAEASRTGKSGEVLEALARHSKNDSSEDNPLRLHSESVGSGMLSKAFRLWFQERLDEPLRFISGLRQSGFAQQEAAESLAGAYFSVGVLAANREGVMSAHAVNECAEEIFRERGLPYPFFRPVIVRRNDSMLEVYNGDTGVVVPGERWFAQGVFDPSEAEVYFPDAHRMVRFGLIGHIEPAFAITIHQSQGSEYHRVAVLMPANAASGLVSRELFYTAVTRVRDDRFGAEVRYGSLDVFGSAEVVRRAVDSPMRREGGLARRIAEALREQSE